MVQVILNLEKAEVVLKIKILFFSFNVGLERKNITLYKHASCGDRPHNAMVNELFYSPSAPNRQTANLWNEQSQHQQEEVKMAEDS